MAPGAPCTALAVAALSVVLAVSAASPDAYGPARNDPTYRTDWRTMPRERAVPAHARGRRAFGDTDYGTPTSASPQRGLAPEAAAGLRARHAASVVDCAVRDCAVPCLPRCPAAPRRHHDGRGVDGHARLRVHVATPHQRGRAQGRRGRQDEHKARTLLLPSQPERFAEQSRHQPCLPIFLLLPARVAPRATPARTRTPGSPDAAAGGSSPL